LSITEMLKSLARIAGYEVHRRDLSHGASRSAAIAARGVDVVLDVGASEGQYVQRLRDFGYQRRVVSFEPLPDAFAVLSKRLSRDAGWRGVNAAAGEETGIAHLQVPESTVTSSVLTAREELRSRIEAATPVRSIEVEMVALDDIWDDHVSSSETPFLKIDVQGYEHAVLNGCRRRLAQVLLVEVEMGLIQLYEAGSTIYDLLPRMHAEGFAVISIDAGFVDRHTGQVLDVDVLMGRPMT
jgi:FkbM family methyltransferase